MRKSLVKTGVVIGNLFISGTSAVPLFLIGYKATQDFTGIPTIAGINGVICALLSIPIPFNFIDEDYQYLRTQWRIADTSGKGLILGSYVAAFPAAGLLNTYYMIGPLPLKVASLALGFFARALITEWSLRARLAFKPKYKNVYSAYHLLRLFLLNLLYNERLPVLFDDKNSDSSDANTVEYQALFVLINDAAKEIHQLPTALKKLSALLNNDDTLVITDLQTLHPQYGKYISRSIILLLLGLSAATSYTTYWGLAWRGAACVVGSGFENNFGDDPCPIVSTTGEYIGRILGYLTFSQLTLTTIFPMISLVDAMQASRKNKCDRKNKAKYIAAILAASGRISVIIYLAQQSDGSLASLSYSAITWFLYNFFSGGVIAPAMLKKVGNTIISTVSNIWQSCRNYCLGAEVTQPLLEEKPSISSTIRNTKKLLFQCLFRPDQVEPLVNTLPSAQTNGDEIDITYT